MISFVLFLLMALSTLSGWEGSASGLSMVQVTTHKVGTTVLPLLALYPGTVQHIPSRGSETQGSKQPTCQ